MAGKRNDPNKTGAVKIERCLEAANASDARRDFRVPGTPGLYFRVTPNGVKSWSLLYTDKRTGKKRRLCLGRYIPGQDDIKVDDRQGVTLAKARQLAREHIADVGKGADPAKGVSTRREALTFKELAEQRLAAMPPKKGNRKRRSIDGYRSMLRLHINPVIGDLKAAEIRKADIKALLTKVKAAGDARFLKQSEMKRKKKSGEFVVPKTILPRDRKVSHQPNRAFELVRSIFRWAVSEDLLEIDPISGMKPPVAVHNSRSRSLSEDEIPGFWRIIDEAAITRVLGLAMKTEIATGQRTAELILRKKSEIDRSGVVPALLIPGNDTKNERPHRVPLSPIALALIEEASALDPDSEFIFASPVRDAPLEPGSATQAMGRLHRAGTVTDLRVHDLRRTASNGMRRCKVPKFIVSVVLHHISVTKSDVTSEHYLDEFAFEDEKIDALLKWGARLQEILAKAGLLPSLLAVAPASGGELSTATATDRTALASAGRSDVPDLKSEQVSLAAPASTTETGLVAYDLQNEKAEHAGAGEDRSGLSRHTRLRRRRWSVRSNRDGGSATGERAVDPVAIAK